MTGGDGTGPEVAESLGGLPVLRFADATAFERWLGDQPASASGAWLKIAKKGADVPTVDRSEMVDALLCAGWIDGQTRAYDAAFFLVRVTPRRRRSDWSAVNCARALALIEAGRMRAGGLAEVETARADGRWDRAYPAFRAAVAPDDLQRALDAHPAAAAAYAAMTKSARYAVILGIVTARRPETRARRIAAFIDAGRRESEPDDGRGVVRCGAVERP